MQLFVNDLTVIDFSYLCPIRGVVGESWIVDLILHGSLDEQSMVLDFAKVKKQVKTIIDENVDHKLAVPELHPNTRITKHQDGTLIDFSSQNAKQISVFSPDEAFCLVDSEQINEQSVIEFLQQIILADLPNNVEQVDLTLRAENIDGFYYHYTHGLKKHDGNCQRITHGHRSKVIVQENGMKSPRLQKYWAQRWQDSYLASLEDQIKLDELKVIAPNHQEGYLAFAYQALQGYFELMIHESCTEIVPCDTTVECLAEYMNQQLVKINPDSKYRVTAFEGVAKGAIV